MIISVRNYSIRDASMDDVKDLSVVFSHTYPESENTEWFFNYLLNGKTINRIAEINGKVVGFATATPKEEKIAMMDIFISPQHQGIGIGTTLFNDIKSNLTSNGFKEMCWAADSNNHKALGFYKKMGAGNGQKQKDRVFYKINLG